MCEIQTVGGVARQGVGGIAAQHIDFFGLKRRQALHGGQGRIFDLVGIAKYGNGNCPGGVNIQTLPDAFVIRHAESKYPPVHTGNQITPGANILKRAGQCKAGRQNHRHHDNNT